MIHDVDESLRRLIRRDVAGAASAEISFEPPSRDWIARQTGPALNLFLHEIREDESRRDLGAARVVGDDGHVRARRAPPRSFRLTYLLSVWTQRAEDEHRLLSALLLAFIRLDRLPADLLVGALGDVGLPVTLTVAKPPGHDRSLAEVWSTFGAEMKASLDLRITAPMDPGREFEVGPILQEPPRVAGGAPRARPDEAGGELMQPSGVDAPGRGVAVRPGGPARRPER